MMDTILNLGLNDDCCQKDFNHQEDREISHFAYMISYRRFIQMFSDVVKEVNKEIRRCLR